MGKAYEIWYEEVAKLHDRLDNRTLDKFQLPSQNHLLFQKIADAFFWFSEKHLGCLVLIPEQSDIITGIVNTFTYNGSFVGIVRVGIAYVYAFHDQENQYMVPLFIVVTVKDDQKQNIRYVDHLGTIYNEWNIYLKNNTWRGCRVIFSEFYVLDIWETSYKDNFEQGIDEVMSIWNFTSTVCKVSATMLTYFPKLTLVGDLLNYIGFVLGGSSAGIGVGTDILKFLEKDTIDQKLPTSEKKDLLRSLIQNVVQLIWALMNYNYNSQEFPKQKMRMCLQIAALYFSGRSMVECIADWKRLSNMSRIHLSMAVRLFSLTTLSGETVNSKPPPSQPLPCPKWIHKSVDQIIASQK